MNYEYHPLPLPYRDVYGVVSEAIERRRKLEDRLSHYRQVFIESTAKPRNDFYEYYLGEIWKDVDQHPKNLDFVWKDVTEFNATGFPDFLPGSEK